MRVEGRPGLVSVEYFRSDADIPGQPIGLFRFAVEDSALGEIEDLVAQSKLGELHPAMKGHPGYTQRVYTLTRVDQTVQVTVNDSDEQTNGIIAPLRNRINSLLGESFKHPERAVRSGISRNSSGFEVTVTNIGLEKICFADPQWLAASGPLHRAEVMVTEFPQTNPGESPLLNWQSVPLSRLSHYPKYEPLVVLDSHGVWRSTATWNRPAAKRYLAYFTWANYQGEAMVNQVYRIRGRADSPRLVIEP